MALTAEELNKLQQYRSKMLDGTLTVDDMKDAIILMTQKRTQAQIQPTGGSAKPRGKSSAKPISALLGELDAL